MSACVEAAPPIAAPHSSTDLRAARLAIFEREQLIVDYLNRGVSVADLAVRVAVGDKSYRKEHKCIVKQLTGRCASDEPRLIDGFAQVDAKVARFGA